ncbi:ribosomal protein S6 kinase alpha-2 [Achlya hypogyna]|uniref:Ribosomal protein S6 kinase alpha-2 n=1 Tax=Achlya hypogyna TaxID=1202772 RepID=A0A1V9YCV4_ACHHY|nr:ribosomal protein S6 kinase alpha-2 [Achlya hypogyna]
MLSLNSLVVTVHSATLHTSARKSYVRVTCNDKRLRTPSAKAPAWQHSFQFIAPRGFLDIAIKTKASTLFAIPPYVTYAMAFVPIAVLAKNLDHYELELSDDRGTICISTEWCYIVESCRNVRFHFWRKCAFCARSVCKQCANDRDPGLLCWSCVSERTRAQQSVESPLYMTTVFPYFKESAARGAETTSPSQYLTPAPWSTPAVPTVAPIPRRIAPRVGLEDFTIAGRIGRGGHGEVLLVKKLTGSDAGTAYAMKVQTKTVKLLQFVRLERKLHAKLQHPHLAPLVYAFQTKTKTFLVLPLYTGGDLHNALRFGGFDEDDARFYLAELYLALQHMHSQGYLHLDVKPGNILLGADGHLVLSDLGMSAPWTGAPLRGLCGTLTYAAPEIPAGLDFGPAADWWSYGVVAYTLLTGSRPFRHKCPKALVQLVLHQQIVYPPELSPAAASFLQQLLERDATKRLQGPDVMAHDFFASMDWAKLRDNALTPPVMMAPREPADAPQESTSLQRVVGDDSAGLAVRIPGFAFHRT